MVEDGRAADAAATGIDDGAAIDPSAAGVMLGDVGDPDPIGSIGAELPLHRIIMSDVVGSMPALATVAHSVATGCPNQLDYAFTTGAKVRPMRSPAWTR